MVDVFAVNDRPDGALTGSPADKVMVVPGEGGPFGTTRGWLFAPVATSSPDDESPVTPEDFESGTGQGAAGGEDALSLCSGVRLEPAFSMSARSRTALRALTLAGRASRSGDRVDITTSTTPGGIPG